MHPTEVTLRDLIQLQSSAKSIPYLASHHTAHSPLLGGHLSRQRGRGMEFSDVRAYQAGDDIRHMDWRLTARTGEAYTKLYQEERERPVYLIVDYTPSMHFATRGTFKSVLAAQIAAMIAWVSVSAGDRVGGLIRTPNEIIEIRPRPRKRGIMALLQSLVTAHAVRPNPDEAIPTWTDLLDRLTHVAKPGSLCVFISDWLNMRLEDLPRWHSLERHHHCLAFMLADPIEMDVPPPGRYPIHDGERLAWLDLENPYERDKFQTYFAAQHEQAELLLNRIPMQYQRLLTTHDITKILPQYFRGQLPELRHAG